MTSNNAPIMKNYVNRHSIAIQFCSYGCKNVIFIQNLVPMNQFKQNMLFCFLKNKKCTSVKMKKAHVSFVPVD